MGHSVQGFIAAAPPPPALANRFLAVGPLQQGFHFLAWDEDFASVDEPALPETTETIGTELADSLGRCALVATFYFGGHGKQAAAVWEKDGAGMRWTAGSGPNGPISTAMRLLGVAKTAGAMDEFEAVGLNGFRSNDDFADLYAAGSAR